MHYNELTVFTRWWSDG